jgi:glycine cleavage system H protein
MDFLAPSDRLYSDADLWAKKEAGGIRVGITDFAQSELGEIVFVSVADVGALVTAGSTMGDVESMKTTSELIAPVSGTVLERNHTLESEPELLNTAPYDEGWLALVEPGDASDFNGLMDGSEYSRSR